MRRFGAAYSAAATPLTPPARRAWGWRLTLVAGFATCGILAITAGLFLLVPRTARAAAMLFPNAPHLTGFSNIVDLGTFGEISKDTRPVMHILAYSKPLPPQPEMARRGAEPFRRYPLVGTTPARCRSSRPLRVPPRLPGSCSALAATGHRMLYRVEVNASDTGTLFIAGIPEIH